MTIIQQRPGDANRYAAYSPDTRLLDAIGAFFGEFGVMPSVWFDYQGQTWLGPVPEKEAGEE